MLRSRRRWCVDLTAFAMPRANGRSNKASQVRPFYTSCVSVSSYVVYTGYDQADRAQ